MAAPPGPSDRRLACLVLGFVLSLSAGAACPGASPDGGLDAGPVPVPDAGAPQDAGTNADAGKLPPFMPDGGSLDAGTSPDAGQLDAGAQDAGAPSDAGQDAGPVDAGAPVDLTEALFDPEHVLEVEVTLDPDDWDELRTEARTFLNILAPGCTDQPFPQIFTWFPADATVDGNPINNIAVRKKGFLGSLSETKPSLKLDFDRFVLDQSYSGTTRMTFNNSQQDPSYVRQCLAYQVFEAAGLPAPRCNFAHITVNGQDLGLYVHVEAVKKPFLRRHFDDDEGFLYEATLSDFRDGWMGTYEAKNDELPPSLAPLEAIRTAIELDDDLVLQELDPVLDVEQFYTFWATEVLTGHWDGYNGNTNNHFLYQDPASGKVHFLPWGTDGSLVPTILFFEGGPAPASVLAVGALSRRLYLLPDGQAAYSARLEELLDTVWDEGALVAELERMGELIAPYITPAELAQHQTQLSNTRIYIDELRGRIAEETDGGPAPWPYPLRDVPCWPQVGEFAAGFSTTFGTYPSADYRLTGTGGLSVTLGDAGPLTFPEYGSGAGDDANPDRVILIVPGYEASGVAVFAFLSIDRDVFVAGTHPIDDVKVKASVSRFEPGVGLTTLGVGYQGTLLLTQAGTDVDDVVLGSVSGDLTLAP